MDTQELKKELKKDIKGFIKLCGGNCSVAVQQVDTNIHAYAEMEGVQVSWCHGSAILYTPRPKAVTFVVPYDNVEDYSVFTESIEIRLEGRHLMSIRKIEKQEEAV
jgi:hypothetical protein